MIEALKEFFKRLKIFFWYLATEPYHQLKDVWKKLSILGQALNKTFTWSYIFVLLAVIAMIVNNRFAAGMLLLLLLFTILLWEWERGYFMYRYREHLKDKLKKIEKEEKRR